MKKLQIISITVLVITIIGFMVWRLFVPFPDWFIRVDGILMLVSIFTTVFGTIKITAKRH